MRTLLKTVGHEKGIELIRAYLRMPDQWFLKKRHDLPTLMQNLNAVSQFLESGRLVTGKEIQHAEKSAAMRNLIDDAKEGGF